MGSPDLKSLHQRIRVFPAQRDWDQFHDPKNLVMALVGEAGELTEIFQWLTPAEAANAMSDPTRAEAIRDELADTAFAGGVLVEKLRSTQLARQLWGVDHQGATWEYVPIAVGLRPPDLASPRTAANISRRTALPCGGDQCTASPRDRRL
jgi:NTP pyrophosphatase (non-canonical NTP hydrolase)